MDTNLSRINSPPSNILKVNFNSGRIVGNSLNSTSRNADGGPNHRKGGEAHE